MAEPSNNVRRALRGHLGHLLELNDKVHEICSAGGSSSVRFNYLHCLDGEMRDDIVRSLEDFRQEVN